jgi:hypothetical protein
MTYDNIKMFVYIYMFQKYLVIIMEIFVFVVGQGDFVLDEVISASPHDASFLAHVSLKFYLSVTNQKVKTLRY